MSYNYLGSVWNSLKFNAGSALSPVFDMRYRLSGGTTSNLVYKNAPRHKNVLVHVAKLYAQQLAKEEINRLMSWPLNHWADKLQEASWKTKDARNKILIKHQQAQSLEWGMINVYDTYGSPHNVVAKDMFGNRVREALILYYDAENFHTVEEQKYKNGQLLPITKFSTKCVYHIDLIPKVTMSSTKNIVMSPVQGRDYTRKELVSGGDLGFTVNGTITSNEEGVYPDNDVKKFIQIMQYNGIINVKYFMFHEFNISKIIIKSYSLGEPKYKNEQPYSFTCVAVEPDDVVTILKDTVTTLNQELAGSPLNKWYQFILNNKWGQKLSNAVVDQATGLATDGVGMLFDDLVPNI